MIKEATVNIPYRRRLDKKDIPNMVWVLYQSTFPNRKERRLTPKNKIRLWWATKL